MKPNQLSALVRSEIARQFLDLTRKLLTIQDIAIHLQCHVCTFRRNRKKWRFPAPAIKEGQFIRWTPDQLTQWENRNTHV
jgi:hypothetical protein